MKYFSKQQRNTRTYANSSHPLKPKFCVAFRISYWSNRTTVSSVSSEACIFIAWRHAFLNIACFFPTYRVETIFVDRRGYLENSPLDEIFFGHVDEIYLRIKREVSRMFAMSDRPMFPERSAGSLFSFRLVQRTANDALLRTRPRYIIVLTSFLRTMARLAAISFPTRPWLYRECKFARRLIRIPRGRQPRCSRRAKFREKKGNFWPRCPGGKSGKLNSGSILHFVWVLCRNWRNIDGIRVIFLWCNNLETRVLRHIIVTSSSFIFSIANITRN